MILARLGQAFEPRRDVDGARAQKATDLWSLGIVTYILLTHDHPFHGGYDDRVNEVEALERIEIGHPQLGDDIPSDLRSLIPRWLAVDPDDRGTALEAMAALDRRRAVERNVG